MNKYLVEFVGTIFFLYVIIATGDALAIGAALAIAVLLGGMVNAPSNFNPAVSVMMAAAGKLSKKDLLPFIIAQVLGGIVALELYRRTKK